MSVVTQLMEKTYAFHRANVLDNPYDIKTLVKTSNFTKVNMLRMCNVHHCFRVTLFAACP